MRQEARHPQMRQLERLGDDDRVAYLRAERLRRVLGKTTIVDRLLEHLRAPPSARRTSAGEKLEVLFDHALELAGHGKWSGYSWADVLVVALDDTGNDCFDRVHPEERLSRPIERFLRSGGWAVAKEIPIGHRQVDVLGHGQQGKRVEFVGVELKSDADEWNRGLEQLATYAMYCHRVYLACSPGLALDLVRRFARGRGSSGWNPAALEETLGRSGFGLLLVEGPRVYEHLAAARSLPDARNIDHLASRIAAATGR